MSGRYGRYVAALGGLIALSLTSPLAAQNQPVGGKQTERPAQQQTQTQATPEAHAKPASPPQSATPVDQRRKAADLTKGQNPKDGGRSDSFWNAKATDWAIVFLTFGLLIVGAVQAVIYFRQAALMRLGLRETSKSNIVARKAANAAALAAEAAQKQANAAEAANRAFVFVGAIRRGKVGLFNTHSIEWRNYGLTAAVVTGLTLAVVPDDELVDPRQGRPFEFPMGHIIPANEPWARGTAFESDFHDDHAAGKVLYMIGQITYLDVHGRERRTWFTRLYSGDTFILDGPPDSAANGFN